MPDEHSLYVTVKPNTMKSKENNNAGLGLLLATFLVVQLPASLFPLIFPPYFTGKVSTGVNLASRKTLFSGLHFSPSNQINCDSCTGTKSPLVIFGQKGLNLGN